MSGKFWVGATVTKGGVSLENRQLLRHHINQVTLDENLPLFLTLFKLLYTEHISSLSHSLGGHTLRVIHIHLQISFR